MRREGALVANEAPVFVPEAVGEHPPVELTAGPAGGAGWAARQWLGWARGYLKRLLRTVDKDWHRAELGGFALAGRPSRLLIATELGLLAVAIAAAIWHASVDDWDLSLFVTLLVFSAVSDLRAVETGSKVKISGSFLALVLAMVFLGGSPAAAIGASTIVVGWLRWRDAPQDFLINLTTYVWFPFAGGTLFRVVTNAAGIDAANSFFYPLVLAVFLFALAINFSMIALHNWSVDGVTYGAQFRKAVVPVISSEAAAATMAVGIALVYHSVGLAAVILFAAVLFTFQHLIGQLLVSEERAEELERRTRQLASLQVGLLSALLHTLDLRDRMTARHSAAVARYSKEIAQAAGFSDEDQDLVHTAALLHDVGKFIFPDRILKGDNKLTDEDWNIIRMHPYQGARIVSQIEGYGPVGEIIIAHHERPDGKGYPRRLKGEAIPPLARIISVADIYDVMTARDSYRKPISSFEAIRELRRVAGTQLDPDMVEVFIQVLAGKDVRYRHGEAADFDAELALEKRVHDYAVSRAMPQGGDGAEPSQADPEPERTPDPQGKDDDDPRPDDNGAGEKATEVPTSVARASARGVDPQQPKAG